MTRKEKSAWVTIGGIESCVVYTVSACCAVDRSPWSDWSPEQTVVSLLNRKHCLPPVPRLTTRPRMASVDGSLWFLIHQFPQYRVEVTGIFIPISTLIAGVVHLTVQCGVW